LWSKLEIGASSEYDDRDLRVAFRTATLEVIKRGCRYDIIAMPSIHNVPTTPHVGGESWKPTTLVSLEDGYWPKDA
jgi:hypothetical protein